MRPKRNSGRKKFRSRTSNRAGLTDNEVSIASWDKAEDIPLDEEDQCEYPKLITFSI